MFVSYGVTNAKNSCTTHRRGLSASASQGHCFHGIVIGFAVEHRIRVCATIVATGNELPTPTISVYVTVQ